jgi:hypothetical protein
MATLERMEHASPAQARKGLMMMVNDIIEDTLTWLPEQVAALDRALDDSGAPSLTRVRGRYSRQLAKVLARGVIRTEIEFYLLKGARDGTPELLEDASLEKVDLMLSSFEQHHMRGRAV